MNLAELFATVGYKVDEASIKKYDAALEKSKEKTKAVTEQTEGLLKRMQELEAARNREEAQVKEFIRLYDKLIEKKGKSQEEKKKDAVRAAEIVGFGPLKPETAEEKKKRADADWQSTVTALNAGVELVGRGFDFVRGKISGMISEMKGLGGSSGELLNLSKRTGLSTDALQELGHAASQNGSDIQTLTAGWRSFTNKVDAAAAGSKSAAKAFKEVGVSAKDIKSGKVSLDEALGKVADKFSKMEDGTKKTALAMDLFGGAGQKLIPLLNLGGAEIGKFREEARKLGVVIDKQGLESLAGFDDQSNKLNSSLQALRTQALAAIVPQISKVVEKLQAWLGENREKAVAALTFAFDGLAEVLSVVVDGVGLVVDAFAFLNENRDTVVAALGGMAAAFLAFKAQAIASGIAAALAAAPAIAAWALAALPFVAIGVAVAALIKFFPQIVEGVKVAAGAVKDFFVYLGELAVKVFDGIKAALAFYIDAYVAAFSKLWEWIKKAASAVVSAVRAVVGFYVDTAKRMVRGIMDLWDKIKNGAIAVGTAIRDAFRSAFGWLIDKVEWLTKKYHQLKNFGKGPSEEQRQAFVNAAADSGLNYVAKRSAAVSSSSKATTVNNENNITINGANDPKAVAKEVNVQMEGFWNNKMREAAG